MERAHELLQSLLDDLSDPYRTTTELVSKLYR